MVAGCLASLALGASQAKAFVINIGGTNYDVTTFQGNPFDDFEKFNSPENGGTMPWWGSEELAREFAAAVGDELGGPNVFNAIVGPYFATFAGEPVGAAFYVFDTEEVEYFAQFDFFTTYTYAEVLPSPPSSVPGPLPLFGAATAYGMSRRLRRRIKLRN